MFHQGGNDRPGGHPTDGVVYADSDGRLVLTVPDANEMMIVSGGCCIFFLLSSLCSTQLLLRLFITLSGEKNQAKTPPRTGHVSLPPFIIG